MRHTKIICTIGPASSSPELIRALIRAGMDLARINFSHGSHEKKAAIIATIRKIAAEEDRLVAVLADLQGPKLRVGDLPPDGIALMNGQRVVLSAGGMAAPDRIPVPHPELLRDVRPGDRILFDDGALELVVLEGGEERITCAVKAGGTLLSHKGINVPGSSLSMSALTPKDREDLAFAIEQQVDFVALSFVRRRSDILELKGLLAGARRISQS